MPEAQNGPPSLALGPILNPDSLDHRVLRIFRVRDNSHDYWATNQTFVYIAPGHSANARVGRILHGAVDQQGELWVSDAFWRV